MALKLIDLIREKFSIGYEEYGYWDSDLKREAIDKYGISEEEYKAAREFLDSVLKTKTVH